jgi:hypothetical protein
MQELLDKATRREGDREITYTWLGVQDGDGNAPGVRLAFTHDKRRKAFTATFYRFTRQQRDGYAMETHEMVFLGSDSNSRQYAATPCARYSDKALTGFVAAVLALLVDDAHGCQRFMDEAATLVGVTA